MLFFLSIFPLSLSVYANHLNSNSTKICLPISVKDDVKRILAQPFECRKTSLPDGALHNVQKELENMINAIDKDIYSFTPSYGKYLIDCWLGDELVDKLLDVSCQYEKLIKLK